MSIAQQRVLVAQPDPGHSVQARCQALGLARSSFYYQPCGESAYKPELMRLLDEEFTQHNFKGVLGLLGPSGQRKARAPPGAPDGS